MIVATPAARLALPIDEPLLLKTTVPVGWFDPLVDTAADKTILWPYVPVVGVDERIVVVVNVPWLVTITPLAGAVTSLAGVPTVPVSTIVLILPGDCTI